ncbi:MAG TPA: hypothetical protein DIU18_02385 [Gemmatimonadetes bacterium]|nr:hypothetical protein [Gemmatimonadota bacterium]|tara:strand:- start:412 stop:2532 length:2121 start_codon:yes stop_codon:yes gene_type:complete
MTFRIDRIKVKRAGPLESDFEFEPGDLNLIYGNNETGKTYVVESLIRFLFKTNKGAPVARNLRGWDIAGKAIVSGLKSDPVTFTMSGQKLEDYWEDGLGLPRDLARLLVVRAGETLLAEEVDDGVGRDILKDYLSGEGLLDRIDKNIPKSVRKAKVEYRQIDIDKRLDLVRHRDSSFKLRKDLQSLIDDVEEGYASADAYSLRKEKAALVVQLETLEDAKRYHAAQLAGRIEGLQREKGGLPTEGELERIEADVRTWVSQKAEIKTKSKDFQELESTSSDFEWTKHALDEYRDLTSGAVGGGHREVFMLFALLSVTGTVTFGLRGDSLPLIVSAVLSLLFGAMTYLDLKKAASFAGENTELEKLKAGYRTKFGSDLTDRAVLRTKLEELTKNQGRADALKEDLDKLSEATGTLKRKTAATLEAWTGSEVPAEEWRPTILDLKERNVGLQRQIDSIGIELAAVGVPGHEYVEEDPGEKWDSERYAEITKDLSVTDEALKQGEKELEALKLQAHLILGTASENSDLGDLITDLGKKRNEVAQAYRENTAEILAKIQVHTVINHFRQDENSRIAEGLERDELTEPLRAFTGRYRSIRLDDEQKGLVLTSDSDEDYPLDSMSTGAREQVFLALRMGFASIAMGGQTGFLILDDAFQHSDWNRRENLVKRTLSFVQSGWQVFYFTMDDHIKGLFEGVGDKMGDGFKSHSLG